MNLNFPKVMQPIMIGNHFIKNRIIAAPVTLHSASYGEDYPTEEAMDFFTQRAKAGAGIVVCAGVQLLPAFDDSEHTGWDLYKHNRMNRLAELAERIHYYGAKAFMELIGIFADGYVASDAGFLMDGVTPGREIPVEEMEKYKEAYVHCAETLMNLGYDGILLHFGHCIPIAQFLSPLTNIRTDKYGGSTENRVRYMVEILKAIREKVGNNLILEIRMSIDEYAEGGIDVKEGLKIATIFSEYADIIQASCGMITPELMCRTHPSDFLPPTPNVHLAEKVKRALNKKTLVSAIGAIGNLQDAERIIASSSIDFVEMCRSFIADPEIILKSLSGNSSTVVPCIKCMRCHDSTVFGNFLQCSVNPGIGFLKNKENMRVIPQKKKRIAVVGGGPSGIVASTECAKRGHQVVLFEKTDTLGGNLKFAGKVSFKYSLENYKNYLINQLEKSTVQVKLNTNVTDMMLKQGKFDEIIIATGSIPKKAKIKGSHYALPAIDIFGREEELRNPVIIIGGGHVGCEVALHLAKMGKTVLLFEEKESLAADASITQRGDLISQIEKTKSLEYICDAKCIEIGPTFMSYEKDGRVFKQVSGQTLLSIGMSSNNKLLNVLLDSPIKITPVGDCVKVGTVETAVKSGYYVGCTI